LNVSHGPNAIPAHDEIAAIPVSTGIKFTDAVPTPRSAMFSESILSLVDMVRMGLDRCRLAAKADEC